MAPVVDVRNCGDFTPLWPGVQPMHAAWLGLDAGLSWLIFDGIAAASAVLGLRLFRWE